MKKKPTLSARTQPISKGHCQKCTHARC